MATNGKTLKTTLTTTQTTMTMTRMNMTKRILLYSQTKIDCDNGNYYTLTMRENAVRMTVKITRRTMTQTTAFSDRGNSNVDDK